jgi:small redox-active disulfide protein 2
VFRYLQKEAIMEIRILGPGCPRCHEVEKRTIDVLAELNIAADVQKVTDMKRIMEYGIMATPGLVIDGKVRCSGRIPAKEEIRKWIEEEIS